MSRSVLSRLRDARSFALHAINNAGGLSPEVLADATQPLHAALYDLAVIGEALGRVPNDVRSLAPAIPWVAITGMRNYVVHTYWRIDPEIVAGVIGERLDPLIGELDSLIETVGRVEP
jgi:uncharacterized protein with HEPN domain